MTLATALYFGWSDQRGDFYFLNFVCTRRHTARSLCRPHTTLSDDTERRYFARLIDSYHMAGPYTAEQNRDKYRRSVAGTGGKGSLTLVG